MMKYKVGDKVRVKKDLIDNKLYGDIYFYPCMNDCKGQILTISNVFRHNFVNFYEVSENDDYWSDEMFEEVKDNEQVRTVDVGFHLDHCGHRVIKNVWQGGWAIACKERSVFFTTYDCKNQYTLPLSAIDWVIPHED